MTRGVGSQRVTAPPPPVAPTLPQPAPAFSKNLRWTTVALVDKMSRERERLSAAVADEIAADASHDMRTRLPHRDSAAVERNTRRRVYDALKVMVSVGCIQREGKSLRWIGVDDLREQAINSPPDLSQQPSDHAQLQNSPAKLRVAVCEARRTILRKRALLNDLQASVDAFQINSKRQRTAQAPRHRSKASTASHAPDVPIPFPFVVVSACKPDVVYNEQRDSMIVSTSRHFKLHTETDIVCMLASRRKVRSTPSSSRKPRPSKKTPHSPQDLPRLDKPSSPALMDGLDLSDAVDMGVSIASLPKLESENDPVDIIVCSDPSTFDSMSPEEPRSTSLDDSFPQQDTQDMKQSHRPSDHHKDEPQLRTDPNLDERANCDSACNSINPVEADIKSAQGKVPVKDSLSVENAPIICHEELGIPPLADGDSTELCSEDDAFLGLKPGGSSVAFGDAFTRNNDRHLVDALRR